MYKPWISAIWQGNVARSLGDLGSPWLLTPYKSWDDPSKWKFNSLPLKSHDGWKEDDPLLSEILTFSEPNCSCSTLGGGGLSAKITNKDISKVFSRS